MAVEVDVQYLQICCGWATTVPATQGLEFACVLLDLNRGGWLVAGGYRGVGRPCMVHGDLRTGLRIMEGFTAGPAVFNTDSITGPLVLQGYRQRVL